MKRILSLFTIGFLFVSMLTGCSLKELSSTDVSTDVSQYGKSNYLDIRSPLLVFPKTIPKNAKANGYYYSQTLLPFGGANYQIFLNITLPNDEYKSEVDRLSNIKKGTKVEMYDGKPTLKDIKLDKSQFIYPAYVAMLGYDGTSEYALLNDKEHKIIYVFIQIVYKKDIKFDKKYIPRGYKSVGDCNESYNIYP
ncbi:MAG TPA: hypothetical protein VGI04_04160 [Neobacillus sp.]